MRVILLTSKTIKDIQWSFISILIPTLAHLLLRLILARKLGPSDLGLFSLIFAIYTIGMQFAAFGTGAALTKYIGEHYNDPKKIKEFFSSGIIISFISGSIIGILLLLTSTSIAQLISNNEEMIISLRIIAISFPFIALQKTTLGTLNGLRKMKQFASLNIFQSFFMFILTIFLVISNSFGVVGAVIGSVIPTILMGVLSLIGTKKYLENPMKYIYSRFKHISWFGFYYVLATSTSLVGTEAIKILIGFYLNEAEIGYYAVAMIFIQGLTLLPISMQRVTTPTIANYYGKNDYKEMKKFIYSVLTIIALITIVGSGCIIVSGQFLLSFLFTNEYLPSFGPMLVLLIGYSIYSPIIAVGGFLATIDKIHIAFRIDALIAFVSLMFGILLIPTFGILGAALGITIAQSLNSMINIYFLRKYLTNQLILSES